MSLKNRVYNHLIFCMEKFLAFGRKYFQAATDIVFILALAIILLQLMHSGVGNFQLSNFSFFYKSLNLVFSFYVMLISIFLFLTTDNTLIKIGRTVFLFIAGAYLLMSVLWLFGKLSSRFEVESYRAFLAIIVGFIGISFKAASLGNSRIHPALLFVFSFIFLILFGTFSLLLPEATHRDIGIVQALFTATSAVTVTGLAVLDTSKDFTFLGQSIILILIQLGGLGVLTVTNVFALVFKSSSSFRNRLMIGDMIKELENSKTFNTLFKIIALTLLVEGLGVILIYLSVFGDQGIDNPFFFSVFHAVSGFCNAGFSTLSNSLFEDSVRSNYFLQIIICWLIITGGLGYSVMINHYYQVKNKLLSLISKIPIFKYKHQKLLLRTSSNSRIVIITTGILLLAGTIFFYMAESNGVMNGKNVFEKIVMAFFNSTTARTAGFNNINMGDLGVPAVILIMALMWIGASPGSTGGGIKTTTFAITLLNLWNQIRGREILIVQRREIPTTAINQVNSVVILSIFAISFSTFLISVFEPSILFRDILFETISAYSTVGLSLGITPHLNEKSQLVLIIIMFLGRVSFLTFLIGVFYYFLEDKRGAEPYYPKENVFIN